MNNYWIMFITHVIVCILMGAFFATVIVSYNEGFSIRKKIIVYLAMILIVIAVMTALQYMDSAAISNGMCPRCGGKLYPVDHNHKHTYYLCLNCKFGLWIEE